MGNPVHAFFRAMAPNEEAYKEAVRRYEEDAQASAAKRAGTPAVVVEAKPARVSVTILEMARKWNKSHQELKGSFARFAKGLPEVWDEVETTEYRSNGRRVLTFRLSGTLLLAFLFWREHNGRLPVDFFPVDKEVTL